MSQRPGWYDDPHDPTHLRYFDGVLWTDHRAPKTSPTAGDSRIGHATPTTQGETPGSPAGPPSYGRPAGPQDGPQGGAPYGGGWQGYTPSGQGYQGAGVAVTGDHAVLATWARRLGAFVVDYVITGVVVLVAGAHYLGELFRWYVDFVQQAVNDSAAGGQPVIDQAAITARVEQYVIPLTLIALAVFVVYQAVFLATLGATPGKLMVGIRVRRWDRPGHPDLLTIARRLALPVASQLISLATNLVDRDNVGLVAVMGVVSLVVGIVAFVDYLWPLWDKRRQALHDKIAGTAVVMK